MKIGSLVSLGGIATILIAGSGYLTFGVVGVRPLTDYVTATMRLPDSGSLAVGSPVLLSGVEVGDITAVTAAGSGVEIGFRIVDSYRVPLDSDVRIENLSALGEPYVNFAPRTNAGPYLADGQTVAADRIAAPRSIPEISRLMTQVLGQLDPATMGEIVDTFDTALDGNEAEMADLARSTELLAAALTTRMPQLATAFTHGQTIAGDVGWVAAAAPAAAPPFVEFSARVDEIAQALGRLFRSGSGPQMYLDDNGLVPFLTRLTAWVDTAGPEVETLLPALRPLVEHTVAQGPGVDLSALISAALEGVGDDALRLRIHVN
ncbi:MULTISPECIES: MlaD family protein [unclassified Nocardia]|uniref:MlaD family protein n=1 Tax=unclassified Nocardia TaxID=2637762 RepID=UPI0033A22869